MFLPPFLKGVPISQGAGVRPGQRSALPELGMRELSLIGVLFSSPHTALRRAVGQLAGAGMGVGGPGAWSGTRWPMRSGTCQVAASGSIPAHGQHFSLLL